MDQSPPGVGRDALMREELGGIGQDFYNWWDKCGGKVSAGSTP